LRNVVILTSELPNRDGAEMHKETPNTILGKLVFAATAIAMVYFFWWLLIFDHGVISVH